MTEAESKELAIIDSNTQTALVTQIDTTNLKKEAAEIVSQIIPESDPAKRDGLIDLFNQNHQKKEIVKINKLDELQDLMLDQAIERFSKRPDEIDNATLMQGLKTVQDMSERKQRQFTEGQEQQKPVIQIQNNEINVGTNLNKESRDKVNNLVMAILGKVSKPANSGITEDMQEIKEDETDGN